MKTKKAAPSATTLKKEPRWQSVSLTCEGKETARLGFFIIPDTYNPKAPLWQRRAGKHGIVATRRSIASILRDWRASGDRRNDGTTPFASALAWILRREMEKEVTHV